MKQKNRIDRNPESDIKAISKFCHHSSYYIKVSIFMTAYWVFPVSFLTVDKGRRGFFYIQRHILFHLLCTFPRMGQDDRFHKNELKIQSGSIELVM